MVAIAPLKNKKVITKIEYSIPCLNLVMPEKENSHLINVRLIMNCPAQELCSCFRVIRTMRDYPGVLILFSVTIKMIPKSAFFICEWLLFHP